MLSLIVTIIFQVMIVIRFQMFNDSLIYFFIRHINYTTCMFVLKIFNENYIYILDTDASAINYHAKTFLECNITDKMMPIAPKSEV